MRPSISSFASFGLIFLFFVTVHSVTLHPKSHSAHLWPRKDPASSVDDLFSSSCPQDYLDSKGTIRSSFSSDDFSSAESPIYPSNNGFVHSAIEAYSQHHHLVIRPDDVWISILSQVGFFINNHAEEMRNVFVSHQGKLNLSVTSVGNTATADFGDMAVQMTDKIAANIKDPTLKAWFMPNFTTTTDTDQVVAAVQLMGSMQRYFHYEFMIICGLPSVTLLGERADWESLLERVELLKDWGLEPSLFYCRIKPVLEHFVMSFDDPTSDAVIDFWNKIVNIGYGCGGPPSISGWITAFTFWGNDGKPLLQYHHHEEENDLPPAWYQDASCREWRIYSTVDLDRIPDGFSSVPVTVNDNGFVYETKMMSGSIGIRITSSGDNVTHSGTWLGDDFWPDSFWAAGTDQQRVIAEEKTITGLDTLQPVVGWWMYKL